MGTEYGAACGSSPGARSGISSSRVPGIEISRALKAALDAWFDEVRKARWTSTADVKRRYATASVLSADRIVFNVKGNDYRLVVSVDFEKGIVWIKWVGTPPRL